MELSQRIQVQKSPDGSWYLTVTIKGFDDLLSVEKFLEILPRTLFKIGGKQLTIEETPIAEGS